MFVLAAEVPVRTRGRTKQPPLVLQPMAPARAQCCVKRIQLGSCEVLAAATGLVGAGMVVDGGEDGGRIERLELPAGRLVADEIFRGDKPALTGCSSWFGKLCEAQKEGIAAAMPYSYF